jgi:peptidoglycan/xylan/chitin deacetylase (PgdA/CDA1 family)
MLISHPPKFLERIYSSLIWNIPTEKKAVYLTFDDGPTEIVTDKVLDLLKKYKAKATFFCLGKNVVANPQIYSRILSEGHQVGNHSQNHLNGWKTNNAEYIRDIEKAKEAIDSNLYRPPYGKIKSNQIKKLRKTYRIIMWSILSRDYDLKISAEKCLKICLTNLKPGSIIVFHDSLKAEEKMLFALDGLLKHLTKNEFSCETIS